MDNVRTEVLDIMDKVREVSSGFNPEVRGSLRPNSHKDSSYLNGIYMG